MNEAGIRVANRAGPQFPDVLRRAPEPAAPQRPAWPFTARNRDKSVAPAAQNHPLGRSFTT